MTNPHNGLVTKATMKVTVKDTKKPKLTGVVSKKTVEYNASLNLKSKVKAKLVSGKNMTSKVVIKIKAPNYKKFVKLSEKKYKKYKFTKLGTYQVEYSVANPYNKKAVAKKTMVITVRDTKAPKLLGVVDARNVKLNDVLNLKAGITAQLLSGQNITANVLVKVKAPETDTFVNLTAEQCRQFSFDKAGVYTIEYSVANPNNPKAVTKKIMTVTVTSGQISPDDAVTPDNGK